MSASYREISWIAREKDTRVRKMLSTLIRSEDSLNGRRASSARETIADDAPDVRESIVITHIFLFPFLSLFLSRGSFTLSVELNVCRFACNYFICLLCNASAPCVSPWRDRPLANRIRIRESGVDLFIGREREKERGQRDRNRFIPCISRLFV